jgi:Flp pilus assembly protein TadD
VVALTSRSAIRSSDWIDAETFFRRTFAAGGSNSRIGVNLAVVYARRGDHAKAEEILRKVLQISPGYSLARANLALALRQQGKSEEAAALLAAPAATATPAKQKLSAVENSETALQQARVQKEKGNTAAALALLARARESNPHVWELVSLEADILGTTAGAEAALSLIEQFAHANWWHASAFIKLGRKQMEAANFAAADAAFRHAARLDVHDPVALGLLASSKVKQNQLSEACAIQQRAVERRPHDPHHRIVLAHILKRMGRDDDAHATLGRALAMQASATSSALP